MPTCYEIVPPTAKGGRKASGSLTGVVNRGDGNDNKKMIIHSGPSSKEISYFDAKRVGAKQDAAPLPSFAFPVISFRD